MEYDDDPGDDLVDDGGAAGVIGKYVLEDGETGVSSKLGADLFALVVTFMGFDANASKAFILDFTGRDTSSDNI